MKRLPADDVTPSLDARRRRARLWGTLCLLAWGAFVILYHRASVKTPDLRVESILFLDYVTATTCGVLVLCHLSRLRRIDDFVWLAIGLLSLFCSIMLIFTFIASPAIAHWIN